VGNHEVGNHHAFHGSAAEPQRAARHCIVMGVLGVTSASGSENCKRRFGRSARNPSAPPPTSQISAIRYLLGLGFIATAHSATVAVSEEISWV
jgi:hypothetical protein